MMGIDERAEQKVNDYLMHYGVKGMKWGKHRFKKEEPTSLIIYNKKKKELETGSSGAITGLIPAIKGNDEKQSTATSSKKAEPTTSKTSEEINEEGQKESEKAYKSYIFDLEEKTRKLADSKELSDQIKNRISKRYQEGYHIIKIDSDNSQVIFVNSDSEFKYEKFAESEMKDIRKVYSSLSQSAIGEELYLEHYGIEGQKWGVKHGPPYPLASGQSSAVKGSKKITVNIRDLSDDELRNIIQRLNMEKQLKELTKDDTKKGESWADKELKKFRDSTVDTLYSIIFSAAKTVGTKKLTSILEEKLNVE